MKKIIQKSMLKARLSMVLLSLICMAGCGLDEKLGLTPMDSVAPNPPTNISVENINGGAIISFTAPADEDLLCVVASYMINGKIRTSKASPYINKLTVDGFGTEEEFYISLKSVDKSKNESQAVQVAIHPLRPPVKQIFETLEVLNSFGGIKISWKNITGNNIIVEVSKKDKDEWVSVENFYSNSVDGQASIRGYAPEPINFRFRIRDRWDNYSEYMETNNLPLAEVQLDKAKFKQVTAMPGDIPPLGSYVVSKIWDGKWGVSGTFWHGASNPNNMGRAITFDLGQKAKISRFKQYQRLDNAIWIYGHNNLKHYKIYGSDSITSEMYSSGYIDPDNIEFKLPTFEGWTEIMDVWCHKPSGDSGVVTNEDKEYILAGDEHEVPIEAPPFRYVRILILENWTGGNIAQMDEITFWGQIIN
ncbi:MAG: DUF4959 domain-containing protein [Prevotellaceae bacterium]|jgi:predicted small lipoprotein YifL|nr:DUF4959 domain-containing protein [Prevotellaceae bacterium]